MVNLAGKDFYHEDSIEDHWMNAIDDYDVCIRDYCRMTLYLVEMNLHFTIPNEIKLHDLQDLLDPLFNVDKVGERPILNVEVDREEGDDINHQVRHVIRLTKSWIKNPFPLYPLLDMVIFQAHAHLEKGKGRKVTFPTFALRSPIQPEMVYQLDHPVGYYHPLERKGKRKRASPQRT